MSVTKENKILASDVSTIASDAKKALPKAGEGITVSTATDGTTVSLDNVVTAGNVGPSANATLAYGGTFTIPYIQYDEHGRVISGATRTMTMPSAATSSVTNISGNAGTATKLQTARTISVKWAGSTGNSTSGTSSFTFDGTANKTATINYYYPSVCYNPYCTADCS